VNEIRTLTFVTIVMANLALIAVNRSWTESVIATLAAPNRAFWAVIAGTLFFLAVAVGLPAAREIFQFAPVPLPALVVCVVAGISSVLWFEVYKLGRARGPA
jgi:Ca2+-transporting ATPase